MDANDTELEVDFREIDTLLREAVQQLPEQQQKVYKMIREEGLSHADIAERLTISRHTVRNHMASALQDIRGYLLAKGVVTVLIINLLK